MAAAAGARRRALSARRGPADILARTLAGRLTAKLGRNFFVENRPGALNYASAGIGTSNHLAGEFFKLAGRRDIAHIPYRGSAPALQVVVGGETQMMFDLAITALPQIEAGTVRALAIASPRRAARTPEPIVARLAAEIDASFEDPALRERLAQQGADPLRLGPAPFAAFVREEFARWARVIREADIKPEG